jgi:hypothetical protein
MMQCSKHSKMLEALEKIKSLYSTKGAPAAFHTVAQEYSEEKAASGKNRPVITSPLLHY